jgi:hypothetical protein
LSQYCPTLNHWPTNIFHKLRQLQMLLTLSCTTLSENVLGSIKWYECKLIVDNMKTFIATFLTKIVLHSPPPPNVLGKIWTEDTTYGRTCNTKRIIWELYTLNYQSRLMRRNRNIKDTPITERVCSIWCNKLCQLPAARLQL